MTYFVAVQSTDSHFGHHFCNTIGTSDDVVWEDLVVFERRLQLVLSPQSIHCLINEIGTDGVSTETKQRTEVVNFPGRNEHTIAPDASKVTHDITKVTHNATPKSATMPPKSPMMSPKSPTMLQRSPTTSTKVTHNASTINHNVPKITYNASKGTHDHNYRCPKIPQMPPIFSHIPSKFQQYLKKTC